MIAAGEDRAVGPRRNLFKPVTRFRNDGFRVGAYPRRCAGRARRSASTCQPHVRGICRPALRRVDRLVFHASLKVRKGQRVLVYGAFGAIARPRYSWQEFGARGDRRLQHHDPRAGALAGCTSVIDYRRTTSRKAADATTSSSSRGKLKEWKAMLNAARHWRRAGCPCPVDDASQV